MAAQIEEPSEQVEECLASMGEASDAVISAYVARQVLNTFRASPRPIAWWRANDFCFDFDRTFIRPKTMGAFKRFHAIRDRHPNTHIALFGHADPVGNDAYNKQLSENRAKVVYGALCRDPVVWKEVYSGSQQDVRYLQRQLKFQQLYQGRIDGSFGPLTKEAALAYMEQICGPLRLQPSDFLNDGKHAFQGCSEFNPVRMMSRPIWETLQAEGLKNARDRENSPNRRVVAFFFLDEAAKQLKESWPCRSASMGIRPCENQFWPDSSSRRQYQEVGREYCTSDQSGTPLQGISCLDVLFDDEDAPIDEHGAETYLGTDDTFCCRFYEGLTRSCKCEQIDTDLVLISLQIADEETEFEYRLSTDSMTHHGVTVRGFVEEWLPPDTTWCHIEWRELLDLPMAEDDGQFSDSVFIELRSAESYPGTGKGPPDTAGGR